MKLTVTKEKDLFCDICYEITKHYYVKEKRHYYCEAYFYGTGWEEALETYNKLKQFKQLYEESPLACAICGAPVKRKLKKPLTILVPKFTNVLCVDCHLDLIAGAPADYQIIGD